MIYISGVDSALLVLMIMGNPEPQSVERAIIKESTLFYMHPIHYYLFYGKREKLIKHKTTRYESDKLF